MDAVMTNLRLLICEGMLRLILRLAPPGREGDHLVLAIAEYCERSAPPRSTPTGQDLLGRKP